ncbi:MAG: pyridoxal phosphate-dependent aminotransferase [Candidatus Cloacimonetes bacterium]|nr:pyridoxal phosphate-dependent aminotransferase [Candidatus Cloacimonadota bacterium]
MKISERVQMMQASPIRKLMPYANSAKEKGIHVYHLNIGQPDIETPKEMIDVYHNFSEKVLAYGPSQGLECYRENLVKYYAGHNIKLATSDIIVTTAGSEAIVFALTAVCNVGDEVLIPEPFYTNYNGFADMAGVHIKPIPTKVENGFALPEKEEIVKLLTSKTRAIMICNPGNPTGKVYSKEEVEMVASIAKEHDIFVISDEVYREFVYDGYEATSILHIPGIEDRAVMVDSVSKRYSACGARIGCIVSLNKELMAAVLKLGQARLCPPTIDQLAASACVNLPQSYFEKVNVEYKKRRDLVFNELEKIEGIVCRKPEGAFYIVAKLPVPDAEEFVIWLLNDYHVENATVMVAPAAGFYATKGAGLSEVRFAYILNENDLKKAMFIFRTGLKKFREIKGF